MGDGKYSITFKDGLEIKYKLEEEAFTIKNGRILKSWSQMEIKMLSLVNNLTLAYNLRQKYQVFDKTIEQ